jgi:undecaprenyl-diphosphatase
MNDLLSAVILGLVEGITEFLPISSTGHLIVTSKLLGFADSGGTFEIVIQLGAILAVLWYYRQDLWMRLSVIGGNKNAQAFFIKLLLAFLPAGILGFLLGSTIKKLLFNPVTVAAAMIVGGLILLWVESKPRVGDTDALELTPQGLEDADGLGNDGLDAITLRQALIAGAAQLLALWPGMSRSASSIVGGMLAGLPRETATAFSFYLALPTLGGATLYDFLKHYKELAAAGGLVNLAIGTVVAFISALLAISWLLRYIAKNDFRGFAWYRIIGGIVILALVGLKVL